MNAAINTLESSNIPMSGILKMLVLATFASLLVAASSGIATIFIRPPDGESFESALGPIAAIAGLAVAAFGSSSMALLFRWRRWVNMPVWAKVYTSALLGFVAVNWIYRIVS